MDNKILNQGTEVQVLLPEEIKPSYALPDPSLVKFYRDWNNRTLWALDAIDEASFDWVDYIMEMNRRDKGLAPGDRQPIKIIISNYGGSLEEAKMLAEVIRLSKTPVWGVVIGMCASAASVLYLSCHKRMALPNATWLFHQGSCDGLQGSYQQLVAFMENYQRDIQTLTNFYKEHTTYDPEYIESQLEAGDWYINIDEALDNGICDEVVVDLDDIL